MRRASEASRAQLQRVPARVLAQAPESARVPESGSEVWSPVCAPESDCCRNWLDRSLRAPKYVPRAISSRRTLLRQTPASVVRLAEVHGAPLGPGTRIRSAIEKPARARIVTVGTLLTTHSTTGACHEYFLPLRTR